MTSATISLCPQCRRALLPGGVCANCERSSSSEQSRRLTLRAWFTPSAAFGILLVLAIVAGGLIARVVWGPSADVAWPIWIVAGLVLVAVEVHYTGDFTLFCFGISALLVGLCSLIGGFALWAQLLGFGALSTVLLFSARQWLRRKMIGPPGGAELENIIGQSAITLDDLPAYGFGKARLRGTTWSAHNATHTRIPRGQRCKVMKMNGLTLWLMPE